MDKSPFHSNSPIEPLDDEWDTEGFVVPSFGNESPDHDHSEVIKVEDSKTPPVKAQDTLKHIYLGPHGAPPQPKQELNSSTSRKQRFKQKLKEADKKTNSGRENKVETLRELIGGSVEASDKMTKGSSKEWLDPHCDESLFNRWNSK